MNRSLTRRIRSESELPEVAVGGDRILERAPGIAYWMFNFEPRWEAASRELKALATSFRPVYGTRTISLNLNGQRLAFTGGDRHIPITLAPAALPMLMHAARAAPVNHILASPAERLLTPRLARLGNTILTITKGSPTRRKRTLVREFSSRGFIERYGRLYAALPGGGAQEAVRAIR